MGERGGSVVECRTPEREVRGSKPTAAVLCPWARHFTPRKYWLITQEALAPSRHDWKIIYWAVKPQHKQTNDVKMGHCLERLINRGGGGGGYFPEFLVGMWYWSLWNMTHFYNPEIVIFRPIFIILAKRTQIYNFELDNHNFISHIYIFFSKYHTHIYNLSRKPIPYFPHITILVYHYTGSYTPGLTLWIITTRIRPLLGKYQFGSYLFKKFFVS